MGSGYSTPGNEINDKQVAASASAMDVAPSEQAGSCPMRNSDGSYRYDWGALFNSGNPHHHGGSINKENIEIPNDSSKKPVAVDVKSHRVVEYNVYGQPILNPSNNMPHNPNQLPSHTQSLPLSTERVPSSIPKGGGADVGTTWSYPSPQMFYNALARKGKLQETSENDMDSVVALHNNMNEKTWRKVIEWETVRSAADALTHSKLLKFQGRPTDISPKAAFKHYILGHPLPFDRHDWVVQRSDGTLQRYVIDYYYDESRARDSPDTALPAKDDYEATPSLLVDVRPAVDTIDAIWNRLFVMPYARHVAKSTNFEPLPMKPTTSMKSNVAESVLVWQSIQQKTSSGMNNNSNSSSSISEKEAKDLANAFKNLKTECKHVQLALDGCRDDDECTRMSIDLTLCMAKRLCPLQHQSLVKTLNDEGNDAGGNLIDVALERVSNCISQKTLDYDHAKVLYPKIFR